MNSIIIPAYNESNLIIKTLDTILSDQALTHFNIVIVCNGCTDDTGNRVNDFIEINNRYIQEKLLNFKIIETDIASKTHAINLGIQHVKSEIIILLDADILIEGAQLIELVNQINKKDILAASPRIKFDYSKSSYWVRKYYQIEENSFYNNKLRLSNVIALHKQAIDRIGKIPAVIADDEYIRRQLTSSEYAVIDSCQFTFICSQNIKNLFNVLTRVERGNLQLHKMNVKATSSTNNHAKKFQVSIAYLVFITLKLFAKMRAKWQFGNGNIFQWERDESNR